MTDLGHVVIHMNAKIVGLYELLETTIDDLRNIRDERYNAKTLDEIINRLDDVLIGNDYYVSKEENAKD